MVSCYSLQWEKAIDQFVSSHDIEILHVHDLPLIATAQRVARKRNIPIVADLHENYPAMLAEVLKTSWSRVGSLGELISRLSVSIEKWTLYERQVLPKVDRIVTVVDEARDRIVTMGIEPSRVVVVGNYATNTGREGDTGTTPSGDESEPHFKVVYAGSFGATRDLSTVVSAAQILTAEGWHGLEVILVGGTGKEFRRITKLVKDLGVSDVVRVYRWLPLDTVESIMSEADVGLVPHVKSPHTDATIPHKLFQYMWRRLPVIVSDCAPLQRIVSESDCGLVYPSGDAAALATAIKSLYEDREKARRMGDAGRIAVDRRYNWNAAGDVLRGMYRRLEGGV